jgi:predicted SAM-dependent methyltransferase
VLGTATAILPTVRGRGYWSRARRELRNAVVGREIDHKAMREDVAARYLRGHGLEIGALNFPLRLPRRARARYVDRQPHEELVALYGHMYPGAAIVAPDVIDDGERLSTFDDSSADFIVANHMLEHTEDPVGTIEAHLRVVRPGGILFYALPDARRTEFDRERRRTTVEHVLRDHHEGPGWSRRDHYREWVRLAERFDEQDVERRAAELEAERANIHFHVWEPRTFAALLGHLDLPFELELLQHNHDEFLVLLRRTP